MSLLLSIALVAEQPVFTVTCDSPLGQAYYMDEPDPRWISDGVKGGKISIEMYWDEPVRLLITDVTGREINPTSQGATVTNTSRKGSLSVSSDYGNKGILDTFLVYGREGKTYLLWTNIRDSRLARQGTRVAAFVAKCIVD